MTTLFIEYEFFTSLLLVTTMPIFKFLAYLIFWWYYPRAY